MNRLKGTGMKTGMHITLAVMIATIAMLLPPASYAGDRHYYSRHNYGHNYRGHYNRHGHHYRGHGVNFGFSLLFPIGYYSRPYYEPPPRVYYVPVQPQPRVAQQSYAQPPPQAKSEYCREYSRKIMIDGEESMAFGTACLQEDGRWRIVN